VYESTRMIEILKQTLAFLNAGSIDQAREFLHEQIAIAEAAKSDGKVPEIALVDPGAKPPAPPFALTAEAVSGLGAILENISYQTPQQSVCDLVKLFLSQAPSQS
jgi:hypothetical protein